ncbi:gamma-glutamylcyclotransferase family protein [Rhizobium sullae]|uniref:gamma-glutamylcyclotransferase family protein n=1 Tax=Rhizobium sullae TaxID=50338 RepID=UPI000B350DFC|nr:gamma-glutamylcyclotransferase family protein [Rhizobium sullae]
MDAEHLVATYGSLAPGEVNHGQLDGLRGTWRKGTVRGRLLEAGWGAGIGFPGLVLDDEAFEVPVSVFESPDFPEHWKRLDEFGGDSYQRVIATVTVGGQHVKAFVYALAKMT